MRRTLRWLVAPTAPRLMQWPPTTVTRVPSLACVLPTTTAASSCTPLPATDRRRAPAAADDNRPHVARGGMGMLAWAAECSGRGVAAAGRRGYASSAGYYKEAYQVGPNTVPVPPHPVSRPMQVDTLALARQFKAAGVEPAQAEAITRVMSEMMDQLATTMGQLYVCKMELEKANIKHGSALELYKHDLNQTHENDVAKMKREIDRLKVECEKLRAELRYEVDKATSGQRLDLNLARGRIRDDMQGSETKLAAQTSRLDKDINSLRAHLEAMKNETIKYSVGTIVSTIAVGLGLLRIFM